MSAALWQLLGKNPRTDGEDERSTAPALHALLKEIDAAYPSRPSGKPLSFPEDHGAHGDLPMDAWRFAGTLRSEQGRRFGFQLMLSRLGLRPGSPNRPSAWASYQVYRGVFTLTDAQDRRFYAFERFDRAALGLSGYQRSPIQRIWLEDWTVDLADGSGDKPTFELRAEGEGARIDLRLESRKPILRAGASGSPDAGGSRLRAYFISRMEASGSLSMRDNRYAVIGSAFLDHAFGRALWPAGQVAWNRYWIQLDEGRELIVLQLHRRDGSGEPVNSGLWIEKDGSARSLGRDELIIAETGDWISPVDGAHYPTRCRIRLPGERMELNIAPLLANQEINQSLRAWSGAVAVDGSRDGMAMHGSGYVELSGYGRSKRN